MTRITTLSHTALPIVAALLAACSSTSAQPSFEASLPVRPGEPWEAARAALAKLDPQLRDSDSPGARASTAKATLSLAGYAFDEVRIAGLADRPAVRSVILSGKPDPASCDRMRDDLVKALGGEWSAQPAVLGVTVATQGNRSARIVCNRGERSFSIVG